MHNSRSDWEDWQIIELDVVPELAETTVGLAEAPPNMIFDGELPVAKYQHVGESVACIPTGTLYLTTAALYFYSSWYEESGEGFNIIPNWTLDSVTLYKNAKQKIKICDDEILTFSFVVEIFCKQLQYIRFCFNEISAASLLRFQLQRTCFSQVERDCFAFMNQSYKNLDHDNNGWNIYSLDREFVRMNLDPTRWRITTVNSEFTLCDSYPTRFIVPLTITDKVVESMAEFRSSGRVIALSWQHPENRACICRSSQPRVGVLGLRSAADERVISALRYLNPSGFRIIDCRSKLNSLANVAMGGGTENEQNYSNCEIEFIGIDNIHGMRDALYSLYKRSNPSFAQNWLKGVETILQASALAARDVHENEISILVHCSDGWDRTSQVCSVSQILLDPYYRTVEGLEILIDKEWLSFGHKFSDRCGHGHGDFWKKNSERSPIFVQFIDCVYQLLVSFPSEFEFNEKFLLTILDNLYSCWFGTFLYNNCRERENARVKQLTPSLWAYLNSEERRFEYLNESYRDCKAFTLYGECLTLRPRLWCNYFYRTKGIFYCKDPSLEVQQFMEEACTNSDFDFVKRASKKIKRKLFPKNPTGVPVITSFSNSVPVLREGYEGPIVLKQFELIENYLPSSCSVDNKLKL